MGVWAVEGDEAAAGKAGVGVMGCRMREYFAGGDGDGVAG